MPIPIIFYLYGHKIRAMSSVAPTFPSKGPAPPTAVSEEEVSGEKYIIERSADAAVPRLDRDARSAV